MTVQSAGRPRQATALIDDNAELATYCWGAGAPLLCLHGGMGIDSAYLSIPAITGLANPARQVILFDQRGHGRSSRTGDATYTHDRWRHDLLALSRELGLDHFALLGHSYGGFIALEFAARYPERVSHLILASTSAGPVPRTVPVLENDAAAEAYFAARWPLFFAGAEKHWPVFEALNFSHAPFNAAFQRELPRYDLRSRVRQLAMPVLLIVGDQDGYLPDMEWLAATLPQATLVKMTGVGHMPFLEQPEAFQSHVGRFLNRHPP